MLLTHNLWNLCKGGNVSLGKKGNQGGFVGKPGGILLSTIVRLVSMSLHYLRHDCV